MTTHHFAPALAITILLAAQTAPAQDLSPAIRNSAACAPVDRQDSGRAPLVLALDSERLLYNAGERVAISAGTNHGLEIGQRFFVRRPLIVHGEPHGEQTAGWLRIVDARESRSVALVEFSCDAVAIGDHLEAVRDVPLPRGIDRTNATGTIDFSKSARVLYGNDGRELNGDRDFVLADAGQKRGVVPGARFAVYHAVPAEHDARVPVGEAVVVSVFRDKSLLRLTEVRDVVQTGDTLVLREGVIDVLAAVAEVDQQILQNPVGGEGSLRAAEPLDEDAIDVLHRLSFEDLSFDFDKFTLKPDALALLDQVVAVLEKNPTLRIKVEGYSCNIGTEKYNLALGKRRADAVRSYLTHHGIDGSRLTTVSFGESQPKYDNSKKETRRLNRRAALVVDIER